jgi:ATP-binding protein involved in chromosome partitioning
MTNITKDFILQILKEVEDPSQSKDIVSLGLISNITVKDTNVAVTMEVPVHRGSSMEPIRKLAQQKLLKIDNVTSATVVVTAHGKKQAKSSVETEEKKNRKNIRK